MEPYNIKIEDTGSNNPDIARQLAGNRTEAAIDESLLTTLKR
jgi:hypothetical protein